MTYNRMEAKPIKGEHCRFCGDARAPLVKDPRRKQRGFQRNCSIMSGESCPPTPPNMDAIHPHRKQWGILSCFRENALL
jgi:hypothetical protein